MSQHDNHQQNGALIVIEPHVTRQRAMLNRMTYEADADLRQSTAAEWDELDAKKLAEKAADANRTLGKYGASLEALADLYHRLEGASELSAAERATTEAVVREHQRVMAESLRQFCGDGVDAEHIVSEDTAKLRESIANRSRRGRHARTQPRDDDGQFSSRRLPPEQD
jgi:hypothetical protein